MVRPADNIRKDLDGLNRTTAELAEEFRHGYETYLIALGHAVRRQVIMATYHLCTQVYPEEFLALSVGDRGRLQQDIQELGRQGQTWLLQLMAPEQSQAKAGLEAANLDQLEVALETMAENVLPPGLPLSEAEADGRGDAGGRLAGERPEVDGTAEGPATGEEVQDLDNRVADSDDAGAKTTSLDPRQILRSVILAAMAEDEEQLDGLPFVGDPLTPTLLAKHHTILERQIVEVLHRVSRYANRRLRRAEVLPDLPEALLEMASEADMGMPKGRSVPNVLNVMVAMAGAAADLGDRSEAEAKGEDEDEPEEEEALEGSMTHLAAVHLRLADLEFGDVQSALARGKLRTSLGRLRKLGKQYQRTQRELAIAQAEQAWRSVWYTDSDGSPR